MDNEIMLLPMNHCYLPCLRVYSYISLPLLHRSITHEKGRRNRRCDYTLLLGESFLFDYVVNRIGIFYIRLDLAACVPEIPRAVGTFTHHVCMLDV